MLTLLLVPVEITSPFENPLYVAVGQQHQVLCTADGRPKPSISWFKYGGILDSNYVTSFPNGSLVFQGIRELDAGEYGCEARSEQSVATTGFNVTVVKCMLSTFV